MKPKIRYMKFQEFNKNEQIALISHYLDGGKVQWSEDGILWHDCDSSLIDIRARGIYFSYELYYMASFPETLDTFDWSMLPLEYRYIRRDPDGAAYAYTHRPHFTEGYGWIASGKSEYIGFLSCYTNNGMPCDKMILDRPED